MFGISFGEFLLIIIVAVVVIGPKDLPDIARYIIKFIAKGKHMMHQAKAELDAIGKEIGLDEIKNEVAIELANEKARIEKDVTTIIDIYGNEHQIHNVDEIRKDKTKEELTKEIAEYNKINSDSKKS
jgi:sec-independent protein translocase protein TatB